MDKKSKAVSVKVFLIVIATFIVGAGGFYLFGTFYPRMNPYYGWRTYENKELGYMVKYPGEYIVRVPKVGEDIIVFVEDPNFLHEAVFQDILPPPKSKEVLDLFEGKKIPLLPKDVYISISIYKNPLNLSAEEWAENEGIGNLAKRYGIYGLFSINGFDGVWSEGSSDSTGTYFNVVLVKNKEDGRLVKISGSFHRMDSSQAVPIFNRLINSFQADWIYST